MNDYQPFNAIGFHSCDREVGLRVLLNEDGLIPSTNTWDWLGGGVYFWEHDPLRALKYAEECARGKQFNKVPIKTPFVLGAMIDLGNCLNLVESGSLNSLGMYFKTFKTVSENKSKSIPANNINNRALDCRVIEFIHSEKLLSDETPHDTVRCAFPEGKEAYPNSFISSKLHIQICVRNLMCIKGFFLPRPLTKYNPYFGA